MEAIGSGVRIVLGSIATGLLSETLLMSTPGLAGSSEVVRRRSGSIRIRSRLLPVRVPVRLQSVGFGLRADAVPR